MNTVKLNFDLNTGMYSLFVLVFVLLVTRVGLEGFLRVPYTDLHDRVSDMYDSGKSVSHPIPLDVHYEYPNNGTGGDLHGFHTDVSDRNNGINMVGNTHISHPLRPQSFQKSPSVTFPDYTRGLNNNPAHTYPSNPVLYGYLTSQDELDNELYELYELYDYRRGRNGYVYKDSKYDNNRETIYVSIDHKSYTGDILYTGDVITIGYKNKPFVVQEYKFKQGGFGTRHGELDVRDSMEGYGVLRPTEDANNHDVVREEDRFFILYRQEVDRRRSTFYYYVKDKRDVVIQLDKNVYKDLQDGDTVLIPGKEQYGSYTLSVYNDVW